MRVVYVLVTFAPDPFEKFLVPVALVFKFHRNKEENEKGHTQRTEAILVDGAAFLNTSYNASISCNDEAAILELGA